MPVVVVEISVENTGRRIDLESRKAVGGLITHKDQPSARVADDEQLPRRPLRQGYLPVPVGTPLVPSIVNP